MLHELKIYPKYFELVKNGVKCFELRFNDRDFKSGDFVKFCEWDNICYSGDFVVGVITYVLDYADGKVFGLQEGYCIFNFVLSEISDFV